MAVAGLQSDSHCRNIQNMNLSQVTVVEDDPGLRELLQEELESCGYQVNAFESAELALQHHIEDKPDLVISDIRLPGISGMQLLPKLKAWDPAPAVLLITAFASVNEAVSALKQGADDFITKPLDLEHLLLNVKRLLEHRALYLEVNQYRQQQQAQTYGLVGKSRSMRQLCHQIEHIAPADGGVLILGESGTGKELVAKAVHQASPRQDKPFLAINCAGIPAELMESEFFGHAAGAFTGARLARAGLLKEAQGGSLLLDEIGEMPVSLQAKLLRVLQEGTMRPVGSDKEEPVDVRILAATHQDLEQRVTDGAFRADLFYRLETFTIKVPPLRERGEDLELLAEHFLQQLRLSQPKQVRGIAPEALDCLYQYPFAGNVRELQNAIERAYTFCQDNYIGLADLPERIRQSAPAEPSVISESQRQSWPSLQHMQQQYVAQVLEHTGGNKQKAAQILGITRRTLYRWLEDDENGK